MKKQTVLMYHKISNLSTEDRWNVRPFVFQEQIEWLVENNFKFVDASRLGWYLHDNIDDTIDENVVCLTFDDGYHCLIDNVIPLLQKYNATATLFLNTDRNHPSLVNEKTLIKSKRLLLDVADCNVIRIEAHGHQHINFTRESVDIFREDAKKCKIILRDEYGINSSTYCYPYNQFSPTFFSVLRLCGYKYGFCGYVESPTRYSIKRVGAYDESIDIFKSKFGKL